MIENRGRKREPEGQSALPRFSPYNIPPRPGSVKCPHCPRSVMPQGLEDHIRAKHPEHAPAKAQREPDMEPDFGGECGVCGASPIVPATGLCGPCTFGDSDTLGGNW